MKRSFLERRSWRHFFSAIIGSLARTKRCAWLRRLAIRYYIAYFKVDLTQALHSSVNEFASFNDFFTRALKPDLRPIDKEENSIVCPVDGSLSEFGTVRQERLLQAKGHDYSLRDLLAGDDQLTTAFLEGSFMTCYLSPRDYHRVHMPIAGELIRMVYVPGRLLSVSPRTAERVPNLFARNERVICIFKTAIGLMAVILVGATIVGGIETVWSGVVNHPRSFSLKTWDYASTTSVTLKKGEEMGRFQLGSTVIVLFPPQTMHWNTCLAVGAPVRMGEALGKSGQLHC